MERNSEWIDEMTWAVVQTEAQRENAVRLYLQRYGREVYFPRILIDRKRIQALFPSYLFVQIADRWWDVRWAPHVLRLLMAGDRPAPLGEDIVTEIRKREKNGLVMLPELSRRYRKGQAVRIVRGSFEGRIGIYDGMSGRDREHVLLELLGQSVVVNIPTTALALVPEPQIR